MKDKFCFTCGKKTKALLFGNCVKCDRKFLKEEKEFERIRQKAIKLDVGLDVVKLMERGSKK